MLLDLFMRYNFYDKVCYRPESFFTAGAEVAKKG